MEKGLKRVRGSPKSSIIDRKHIGIVFIDFLKTGYHEDFNERLSRLLYSDRVPCCICRYHDLIAEAHKCIKYIHENNIKVIDSRDEKGRVRYHGKGSSKRRFIAELLSPWQDPSKPYPFNLNLDDLHRPPGYVPPGRRRIDDHKILVDRELSGLNPDEVDFELVGYPDEGRYVIEFQKDRWGGMQITVSTTIHLCQKGEWSPVSFGKYFRDRIGKGKIPKGKSEAEKSNFKYTSFPGFKRIARDDGRWVDGSYEDDVDHEKRRSEYVDEIDLYTLQSNDLLDRATCLMLLKVAQGGVNSKTKIEEASTILMNILTPEIHCIADVFFIGDRVQKYNRDGGGLAQEQVRSVAELIGKGLVLGERPEDLASLLSRIGDNDCYAHLLTRRLDEIARYHIEFGLYLIADAFIKAAEMMHCSHSSFVAMPQQQEIMKQFEEYRRSLHYSFDPYSWVSHNDRPLFNITSEAAWAAFKKDYVKIVSKNQDSGRSLLDLQQETVTHLPRRYGIQFSGDAYCTGSKSMRIFVV